MLPTILHADTTPLAKKYWTRSWTRLGKIYEATYMLLIMSMIFSRNVKEKTVLEEGLDFLTHNVLEC